VTVQLVPAHGERLGMRCGIGAHRRQPGHVERRSLAV
jgi:hypothetical protein